MPSTMTTGECARYWGVTSKAADQRLRRAGLRPVSRDPGRGGENRYRTTAVVALRFRSHRRSTQ